MQAQESLTVEGENLAAQPFPVGAAPVPRARQAAADAPVSRAAADAPVSQAAAAAAAAAFDSDPPNSLT